MSNDQIVEQIKAAGWWQGSVIAADILLATGVQVPNDSEYWVVCTQTCNLYSHDFENIPQVEVVAASRISRLDPAMVKGDHPRELHVRARLNDDTADFCINIVKRQWIDRESLSRLNPQFNLFDEHPDSGENWRKNQWLNIFSGWLGRSYTRVALPDEFNDALRKSKIRDVIHSKLTKQGDKMYGIYLSLAPDSDQPWEGILGLMPPPYLLSVKIVVDAGEDPAPIKSALMRQLFDDKVLDNFLNNGDQISRAALARKYGIRLIPQAVEAQTTEEVSLDELRYYIRYSLVDYLSNSSMASPH